MTGSARRTTRHDGVVALALPERRAPRALLIPEVLPGEARRRPLLDLELDDVEIPVPPLVAWGQPYGEPLPRPGLLLDLYV